MTYRDTWAVCERCGKRFVFRVEDQRRQTRRGEEITPPTLCPACQSAAGSAQTPERKTEGEKVLGDGPHEGRVKWYDTQKGYGFIVHSSGEEVFFHRTGLAPDEIPDFADGTRVTFLVEQTSKGPQAVHVERME
jgi:CspA family cold shock protein